MKQFVFLVLFLVRWKILSIKKQENLIYNVIRITGYLYLIFSIYLILSSGHLVKTANVQFIKSLIILVFYIIIFLKEFVPFYSPYRNFISPIFPIPKSKSVLFNLFNDIISLNFIACLVTLTIGSIIYRPSLVDFLTYLFSFFSAVGSFNIIKLLVESKFRRPVFVLIFLTLSSIAYFGLLYCFAKYSTVFIQIALIVTSLIMGLAPVLMSGLTLNKIKVHNNPLSFNNLSLTILLAKSRFRTTLIVVSIIKLATIGIAYFILCSSVDNLSTIIYTSLLIILLTPFVTFSVFGNLWGFKPKLWLASELTACDTKRVFATHLSLAIYAIVFEVAILMLFLFFIPGYSSYIVFFLFHFATIPLCSFIFSSVLPFKVQETVGFDDSSGNFYGFLYYAFLLLSYFLLTSTYWVIWLLILLATVAYAFLVVIKKYPFLRSKIYKKLF